MTYHVNKRKHAKRRIAKGMIPARHIEFLTKHEEPCFVCPACGPRVAVDEDGCCTMCGADAVVVGMKLESA